MNDGTPPMDNRGLPQGSVIGARERPDGTWDMSRALVSIKAAKSPAEINKIMEVTEAIFAETETETPLPGSLNKVIQHIERTIKLNQEAPYDPARAAQRAKTVKDLSEEREVIAIIVAYKAISLQAGRLDTNYEDFLPEAKKISAEEAEDILGQVLTDLYNYDQTGLKEADKTELNWKIKAGERLKSRLIDEQINASQDNQPATLRQPAESAAGQPTADTAQEISSEQEDLEKQAAGLAKVTRERGIGQLYGLLHPLDNVPPGFRAGRGFVLGQNIVGNNEQACQGLLTFITTKSPDRDIWDSFNFKQTHRQVWTAANFDPMNHFRTSETVRKGLFGSQTVYTDHEVYRTYTTPDGSVIQGEKGWTEYIYQMPANPPWDNRPGGFIRLTIIVPPEIARNIDVEVSKNPLFPDKFFQALFPGVISGDGKTNLRRHVATELAIVDERTPGSRKVEIKPYSKPIEY